jgi:hypothetical protein
MIQIAAIELREVFMVQIFTYILLLIGCVLFTPPTIASAADYYVSPAGSDKNSGTRIDSPWKLQYAADRVNAGDIVYLTNGTYSERNREDKILSINRGGTSGAYVTFKPAPGHAPIIMGGGSGIWCAVLVDAPYVRIERIELIGDNDNLDLSGAMAAYNNAKAGGQDWIAYAKYNTEGICIGGRNGSSPHHIEIVGCTVHDFPSGGIQVTKADYVTIEDNSIYNNIWYSMYAESGISIYHSFNHDNNTSSYRMVVRCNKVYNNYTQIPWIDIQQLSDGNGIIIDDNRNTQSSNTNNYKPYTGKILVENNLSYDNGGGGIVVFQSDKVDIVNNTTYCNAKVVEYPEIGFTMAANGRSFNNITYAKQGITAYSNESSTNIASDYNIYYGSATNGIGQNDIKVDPQFTNPQGSDFTLKASSPAINSGGGLLKSTLDINGISRLQEGGGHDRGAYGHISVHTAPGVPTGLHIRS